ncbi:MAG TPA: hypothetical protein VGQ23_14055 [Burkholderiaceae bacterium]|jgi:hypothetical protein|nr:hypothetical protein [Burkholderiaceae bacterium]
MFSTLSDRVDLSGLELSPQPAEREAQVRVLKDVFSVLERHHLERRTPDWAFLAEVSETPAVAAAVDALVQSLPDDTDFGSFDAARSRRDVTGVARLRR